MKNTYGWITLAVILLLPGCAGNLVDWGKQRFPQAKKNKETYQSVKCYAKQINLYDQLNTIGLFDALWLSDEVRSYYADTYARMSGKTQEETTVMLRRLFKANAHAISFYVLTPTNVELTVKPLEWGLYLDVDGVMYQPTFVKRAELPFLYRTLFGRRFNPHKQPYEVKFDRHDVNGKDILDHTVDHVMKLIITTSHYHDCAEWFVAQTKENQSALIASEEQLEADQKAQEQQVLQQQVSDAQKIKRAMQDRE